MHYFNGDYSRPVNGKGTRKTRRRPRQDYGWPAQMLNIPRPQTALKRKELCFPGYFGHALGVLLFS